MNGFIGTRAFGIIIGAFLALAFVGATESRASAAQVSIPVFVTEGSGSISSSDGAITNCRDACTASFTVGVNVTFTANPDPGMGFGGWQTGFCGSIYVVLVGNTCSFTPDDTTDYTMNPVRAKFAVHPPNDNFADAADLVSTGSPGGVDTYEFADNTDGGSHEPDEPVHAADGESASVWAKWTAPAFAHVEASTCSSYTDFDTTLAAYTGTAIDNLQQVGSNDNGPPFTSCDIQSDGNPIQSQLFFEATKGVTYYFAVDGADDATGNYALDLYATRTPRPVTVSFGGNGKGSVISSPVGINCDSSAGTCPNNIGDSRQITLAARPAVGSSFAGFDGACAGTAPCTLTITDATSIKASFALVPHDLHVSTSGLGSGTIHYAGPNTPDCSRKSCVSTYDYGTAITLQPVADEGSKFIGWSGDCAGTGPCKLDMTKDINVSAQFEKPVVLNFGKPVINARKGTALIPITVDQSATIKLAGTGLKAQKKSAGSARTVKVPIKPKGKLLKKLKKKGKARVKVVATAKGVSGDVTRVAKTVRLKKVKKP